MLLPIKLLDFLSVFTATHSLPCFVHILLNLQFSNLISVFGFLVKFFYNCAMYCNTIMNVSNQNSQWMLILYISKLQTQGRTVRGLHIQLPSTSLLSHLFTVVFLISVIALLTICLFHWNNCSFVYKSSDDQRLSYLSNGLFVQNYTPYPCTKSLSALVIPYSQFCLYNGYYRFHCS